MMNSEGWWLLLAVTIVAMLMFLFLLLTVSQEKKFLRSKLSVEEHRTQQMLNLMLAKDLPTLSGLNQVQTPTYSKSSDSEYIPRDDTTEYNRLIAFGGQPGYGEAIFDSSEDDLELVQAISELTKNGQIDYN